MTDERPEPADPSCVAVSIVRILIDLKYPEDPSKISSWLHQINFFQELLAKSWQVDRTGKVMMKCLNVLYDVIALNQTTVCPAVWTVLNLVDEEKMTEIVEGILNDPNTNENLKVQNALNTIIEGLCQYGSRAHKLQTWALVIIRSLEIRKNYSILTTVAEYTIPQLLRGLILPLYRSLIYPIFKQFLYSVVTPYAFYKILDDITPTLKFLEKHCDDEDAQIFLTSFSGLLRVVLTRFPPKPSLEQKYNKIKAVLARLVDVPFEPVSLILWDPDESESLVNWPNQPHIPNHDINYHMPYKGLINQGNTCFMNSILQILYMTTRFRSEILEKEVDPSERVAMDLQQLFAFMQGSNRSVLVPNGIMESTLPPRFSLGLQQDSSEYLIYLLDMLHENENKIIRRKKQTNYSQKNCAEKRINGNGDFVEGATSLKQSNDYDTTVVERLFGGVTMSTTVCSYCKKSFPKNDSFRNLHLSLPDNHQYCDLQELINISLQPEELFSDNMYDCSNCGTKRNATRKQTIIKAPEHLILTLKLFRFDPVRKQRLKLHSRLKSAKTIELPVYNSSQLQTKVVMYDVKGVVLHSGESLDDGHFVSSAVDHSGQWYIFNDSVVSAAKGEWNGSGSTPYILVLRQSDISDPPKKVLPASLQLLVNRDNQKFLADRRYQQRMWEKKKDDDDRDNPPNNGSFGGPGPSLVF